MAAIPIGCSLFDSKNRETMTTNWDLILNFAIAMLAIVNPVEKIPLWVTASASKRKGFQQLHPERARLTRSRRKQAV